MRVLKLSPWSRPVSGRQVDGAVTYEQIAEEDFVNSLNSVSIDHTDIVIEVQVYEMHKNPFFLGFLPERGIFVLTSWWYFEEAEL